MKKTIALLMFMALTSTCLAQSADGQKSWDETLAAARKEGKVVLLAPPETTARKTLPELFQKRYGITLEYIAGRSSKTATKLLAERTAGIYSADAVLAGIQTMSKIYYHNKMLAPLKPELVLPEVVGASNWKQGKPWFVDPEKEYVLRLYNTVTPLCYINMEQVKPGDLQSSKDLLDPKWKGKIAFMDPSVSGTGSNHAAELYTRLGADYVKKLFLGQKVVISRDRYQLTNWLIHGTYPIVFGAEAGDVARAHKQGLPVTALYELSDLPGELSGGDQLGLLSHAPHPNAAKVFVNWMATKEGIAAFGHALQFVPTRTDTTASLPEEIVPKSGEDYFDPYDWTFTVTTKEQVRRELKKLLQE
jgi:iron(III) transport system substrate-binding protein